MVETGKIKDILKFYRIRVLMFVITQFTAAGGAILFGFIQFFEGGCAVLKIRSFVDIVHQDVPDDPLLIDEKQRAFRYAAGSQDTVFFSYRAVRPEIRQHRKRTANFLQLWRGRQPP